MGNFEPDSDIKLDDLSNLIVTLKNKYPVYAAEDTGRANLHSRIKRLPSREVVMNHAMSGNNQFFTSLKKELGEILAIIEEYDGSGSDFLDRHLDQKRLLPRYKTLVWREKMNKANAINGMVKISSKLDSMDKSELSDRVLIAAERLDEDKLTMEEVDLIMAELSKEGLVKESQLFGKLMKNIANKLSKGAQEIYARMKGATQKGATSQQLEQRNAEMKKELGQLVASVAEGAEILGEWYPYLQKKGYITEASKGLFNSAQNHMKGVTTKLSKAIMDTNQDHDKALELIKREEQGLFGPVGDQQQAPAGQPQPQAS